MSRPDKAVQHLVHWRNRLEAPCRTISIDGCLTGTSQPTGPKQLEACRIAEKARWHTAVSLADFGQAADGQVLQGKGNMCNSHHKA